MNLELGDIQTKFMGLVWDREPLCFVGEKSMQAVNLQGASLRAFTGSGHFIVITGYLGGFLVNDPNSIERSERVWSYREIRSRIKKSLVFWDLGLGIAYDAFF